MAENIVQGSSTTRKKFLPVRLKEMSGSDEKSAKVEQPTSMRKRMEPMRVKDLLKSLSARKNPEPASVRFRSRDVEKSVKASRQSTVAPGTYGTTVRRKLYASQKTPQNLNRQTCLFPASKTPQNPSSQACLFPTSKTPARTVEKINPNQTSRKSSILPPNSIKEYYVRKRLSKGTILEGSREDSSFQTTNEPVAETSSGKSNLPTVTPKNTIGRSSEVMPSSQLSTETGSSDNAPCISNIRSLIDNHEKLVPTNSSVPSCEAYSTENKTDTESSNVPLQFTRLPGNDYTFYTQPLLANQILLHVPFIGESQRMTQLIPAINSTCNPGSEHVSVDRLTLLSIETYLKEGIINMTQALNLVQSSLHSNSSVPQAPSTDPMEKEDCLLTPAERISSNSISESIELRDIKIEPTYGDTSPPSALLPAADTSQTERSDEASGDDIREPIQMKSLRIRMENCLINTTNTNETEKAKSPEPQKSQSEIAEMILRTPKKTFTGDECNMLKTPKIMDKHLLMTPCRRMDNKENFQTPMSRRKTFSGLDSQNLRRSVRIARHRLRQSLGDDSFLALERELNIVYPHPDA